VKTCHYTRHTTHYSTTDHPRGRIRRVPYPAIPGTRPYPFTVNPPRPVLDPASTNRRSKQECKACMTQDTESFHRLILYVTMVSRDGRPFSGHVATVASTAFDKTSPLRHPRRLCLLLPYKRAGRGLYEGGKGRHKASRHPTVEDQHLKQPPLYSHFFSLRPRIGSLSHSLQPLRKHLGARKYNTPPPRWT
jgi:hypothetical protein